MVCDKLLLSFTVTDQKPNWSAIRKEGKGSLNYCQTNFSTNSDNIGVTDRPYWSKITLVGEGLELLELT